MANPTAASQGATTAALNTAGSDILPQSGQLWNLGSSNLTNFSTYLNNLTSGNPALVSQAAGPQIANISQQAQNASNQIATLPRGGEQNYLQAENAISESGNVSNLLNQIIQNAYQQQGQLGEFGTTQALGGEESAAGIELGAGQNFLNQAQINAASSAGLASNIGSILSALVEAGAAG